MAYRKTLTLLLSTIFTLPLYMTEHTVSVRYAGLHSAREVSLKSAGSDPFSDLQYSEDK